MDSLRHSNSPDKEKKRKMSIHVSKNYGITLEEYNTCMETSSECEVCGRTTGLCYDHSHSTMKFRGVLCSTCNRAIGQLGDTFKSIERVYNYLKERDK